MRNNFKKTNFKKYRDREIKIGSYRELTIVSKSKQLVVDIYQATNRFPKYELYGLTSQIRRATVSVVLNIVEGNRNRTSKDYLKFLTIADGSLAEVQVALEISLSLDYLDSKTFENIEEKRKEIVYMLSALKRKIKARLKK